MTFSMWSLVLGLASLAGGGDLAAPNPAEGAGQALVAEAIRASENSADWVVLASDNICGLRDKRTLSNPAKVDWDTLLDETAEMIEMKKKGIDPSTARGIELRQKAVERLTNACEAERVASSHCSVWKEISHKDGRQISDLTASVRDRL